MSADLEDIIDSLKNKYGEKRSSQKYGTEYFAIPFRERKDILRHLVVTLKEAKEDKYGVEINKQYFKSDRVRNTIARACFPPEELCKDTKKRKGGYEVVWRELREILAEVWPEDTVSVASPDRPNGTEEYNPSLHKKIGKDIDPKAIDEEAKSNTAIDEEASKLLGF